MKVSPRIIFKSAQQYHAACERLRNAPSSEEAMQVGYPCIYLAVMASELYLKSLYYRLHRKVPHHHILETLFKALTPEIRRMIEPRWDAHIVTMKPQVDHISAHFGWRIDTSFLGALKGASRSNEELRYIWESRADSYTLLQGLPNILQDVILNELGQEWMEWDEPPQGTSQVRPT